ncbi:hypothetical protein [Bacillus sp. OV322]|uniref:hypothetical protein n=1 Tax=Bacillus sp. OV322 TaxID=1882764 RepID=UPI00114D3FE5|nr:hypothetical protein [Bacillus sp. OV322]
MEEELKKGATIGLLDAGKDFAKDIFNFVMDPEAAEMAVYESVIHYKQTYKIMAKAIHDSYEKNMVNGDWYSRAHWVTYAIGSAFANAAGTKGMGAAAKTGMTTARIATKTVVSKAGKLAQIPSKTPLEYSLAVDGQVPYNAINSKGLMDRLSAFSGEGKVGGGAGKVEIKYPLSSTNKKHINKHNIESIKQQYKYLSDSQLADKLESSFFNPKWSDDEINKYAEIAYNDLKNQGKTGKQTYEIGGEIIDVFIHPDGQLGSVYGRHKFTVEDIRKITK